MTVDVLVRAAQQASEGFGTMRERVELLIEQQRARWSGRPGSWLLLPLPRDPSGFYLASADQEGQRQGEEVLRAFLGPAAAIEPCKLGVHGVDRDLSLSGVPHLRWVRRTNVSQEEMLRRIEDAVATISSSERSARPTRRRHVDVLRDFRLSLQHGKAEEAEQSLRELQDSGRLSAENLRFLKIELLGRLGRWKELRHLAYLPELLRVRRPKAINELLLEMIWATELAELVGAGTVSQAIVDATSRGIRFGAVVAAVDVPSSAGGRAVAAVFAAVAGDDARLQRILAAAGGEQEHQLLLRIKGQASPSTPVPDVRDLFDHGQAAAGIAAFLAAPRAELADRAVEAVADGEDAANAMAVLTATLDLVENGQLLPSRRLKSDLEELKRLANGFCSNWAHWASRLAASEYWPEGARTLRSEHAGWESIERLSAAIVEDITNKLLQAWSGPNRDQVVESLDVLCHAAESVASPSNGFCAVVLEILSDQEAVSTQVREAYLSLLDRALKNGPDSRQYGEIVRHGGVLWQKSMSLAVLDWALAMVETLIDEPCPAPDVRNVVVANIVGASWSAFGRRLTSRQRLDLVTLAQALSIPLEHVHEDVEVDDVWSALDGRVVGVYSLMPQAIQGVRTRLSSLCPSAVVDGNSDTVATTALRSLARRSDYLVVDTWHAAHAATGAIDVERPRERQVLPSSRGVSGIMRALENALR